MLKKLPHIDQSNIKSQGGRGKQMGVEGKKEEKESQRV